jgi:hypothetical protein
MGKNSELTAKQRRMIAALLASRTIGEACKSVSIGRTTLARWLADDEFNRALKKAQSDTITSAACQLIGAQERAILVLMHLAVSGQNESVQRAAANDLLNYSLKFDEHINFEERIRALELAVMNDRS